MKNTMKVMTITNEQIEEVSYSRHYNLASIKIKLVESDEVKTVAIGNKGGFYLNLGFFDGFQKIEFDQQAESRVIEAIEKVEAVAPGYFKQLNWFANIEEA